MVELFLFWGCCKEMQLEIPSDVEHMLRRASAFSSRTAFAAPKFTSTACGTSWDRFIETWAPRCYSFVANALGPYQQEPKGQILGIEDGLHSAGVNASFQPDNGQIRLVGSVVQGRAGTTLEKLTHELVHASLANFPEGDPFYEEGFVDYSVWVMAHAPIWGEHRQEMIEAAAFNIACRRDRALKDTSDYDRKRWAGGVFCSFAHGPWIIARLRTRKTEGNLSW
jgi:hypothetical protein